MSNRAAVIALLLPLLPSVARADETTTQTANTVVVVTPNAPVVVSGAAPAAPAAPVAGVPVAAAPELAAPGMQAPALNAPPQNEDWNNVSHINGTPVKVGERGDYLYKYKKFNIAIDPFGFFGNYYDASVSFGLSRNVAFTAAITGQSNNGNTNAQFSVSAPIYFRRTFSGPYIEPGLLFGNVYCGDSCMGTTAAPELLFGWHWNFDSGLNVQMAAGLSKYVGNTDGSEDTFPAAYFRIGYNFGG